jgi:hypothetical protein
MDLRQLQALVREALEQIGHSVIEIVMTLDAQVEYLPQQLLAPAPGE